MIAHGLAAMLTERGGKPWIEGDPTPARIEKMAAWHTDVIVCWPGAIDPGAPAPDYIIHTERREP